MFEMKRIIFILWIWEKNFFVFRSKRRTAGEGARLDHQKFVYEDGFIACDVDRNLVLGVQQQDGRSSVVVMKRSFEDLMQQWVIANNGYVDQLAFDVVQCVMSCMVFIHPLI